MLRAVDAPAPFASRQSAAAPAKNLMSDAGRIPSLDGLRGLAAIAVMVFHFNIFFLPQEPLSGMVPYLGRAYLAVDLFFLLSGFVMAHVYGQALASNRRGHWLRFAIARFARLYPLFALTTLVMVIVFVLNRTPLRVSLSGPTLALQPLLLQQWASDLSWNYPSWSISTEVEAYAYFVLIAGLLMAGRRPLLVVACCVLILISLSLSEGGTLLYIVGARALIRTLAEFSLGVMLYRLHSSGAVLPLAWVALAAIGLAGLGMATHWDFFIVGAFACLIYYCVNARDAVARLLDSRPAVALGNWSYSIYLWHAPTHYVVMAMFAAMGRPVAVLGLFGARLLLLATTMIVVAISAASYRYVETPLRRRILNISWMGQLPPADAPNPLARL
jgi:peptidoglycan/LPS O-acetylase OafA/YrhL